ncbi:MAG: DUF2157 domain-containing protein [Opitutae bacterium]|nr:DUF2157 domain-containing protein [Opitutae bacterium]
MDKNIRWLLTEIERWKADGLVTPEQADRLRQRYDQPPVPATSATTLAAPAESVPWGLLVFSTAGAIIIGLGVILLFAYNWAEIPKAGKLALVFGAIIAAHAGGLRLLAQPGWKPKLGEALTALGTMFYGAGIWLVAQIYNIDEHYPNGFLFWALGALAMAWALRSTANGLLAVILLTVWGGCEAFDFRAPEFWAILLVAGGLLPLAWKQRSILLLAATLAAIQFLLAVNVVHWGGGAHAFTATLAWAVLLVAAARLTDADRPEFVGASTVMAFFGFGAFFGCAYLLSFHAAADGLLDWARQRGPRPALAHAFGWTLFTAGLAGWSWLARRSLRQKEFAIHREDWLLPIALLYCFGLAGTGARDWALFVSWSFNLMLLGLAIMWIWRGCQESRVRPTVLGSLILSAVVLARYFDLFQSLAARGLAFILLGTFFVAEAMFYRKMRQAKGGGA